MTDIESRRAARRASMPIVTAFVEQCERDGFEPRVIYARENGITVGREPQYREVFDIPKGYRMATDQPVRAKK